MGIYQRYVNALQKQILQGKQKAEAVATDVPKAPNVTRKEHSVTSGGVRGPQNVGNTGSTTNQLHDPSAQAAGTSTGSSFGNQVDQALNPSVNGSGINSSGINSSTTNGNGTLGQNNPVLSGSV